MKNIPMPEVGDRVVYSDNLSLTGKVVAGDDSLQFLYEDGTWQVSVDWADQSSSLEQVCWVLDAWRTQ